MRTHQPSVSRRPTPATAGKSVVLGMEEPARLRRTRSPLGNAGLARLCRPRLAATSDN
ncbi:MAG: hypothetical protein ACLR8Y_00360 [Alistipes indistinctus]